MTIPETIASVIGDLERLNICLSVMPYQRLISVLDQERGVGRNDYPNLTMFFIFIAMLLFEQQINYEHMRRTLSGNPSLRELVGLNDEELKCKEMPLVPSEDVFTHFADNLAKHTDILDDIIAIQLKKLFDGIEGFGEYTAGDGKYFDSYAPNVHSSHKAKDRRGEGEATYSIKRYTTSGPNGEKYTKKETHYGYRKHTLVDCLSQMPIASKLTPANTSEVDVIKELLSELPPEYKDRMKTCALDRGYDGTDLITFIKDMGVIPLIDKRMMKTPSKITRYSNTDFYYSDKGEVYYFDRENGQTIKDAIDREIAAAAGIITDAVAQAVADKSNIQDMADAAVESISQIMAGEEINRSSIEPVPDSDQNDVSPNDGTNLRNKSPFKLRGHYELKKEVDLKLLDNRYKFYLTSYKGFDKKTGFLKYHFKSHYVSISIREDERVFLPIARNTKKFKRLYNTRTSTERYHSVLDISLGFERHTIRGFEKMNVFLKLADIVCLSMGVAHLLRGEDNYGSIFDFGLVKIKKRGQIE